MGGRAIITSNTSGLRIAELMQGRSADFRGRFCITHFFNPPRYLKLVEIVAGADTKPETLARAEALCGGLLGKGLVRAKDTPNFIANRIGTFALMRTLDEAVEQGLHRRGGRHGVRPRDRPARRAPCSAPPTSSAWTRWCTSPTTATRR